ncbi:MAG: Calx-beta domain-containing protein [Planctomycetaceae bacterium]
MFQNHIKRLLQKFRCSGKGHQSTRRTLARRRMEMELLEDRCLLAVTAFSDNFESGSFSTSRWDAGVVGTPEVISENRINAAGNFNGPQNARGTYALNLRGGVLVNGTYRGEAANASVDLSGYQSATLSYYVQAGGHRDLPESDDDLRVAWKAHASDVSQTLRNEDVNSVSQTSFTSRSVSLPQAALTSTFLFGFSANLSDGDASFQLDDWFIDDVVISGTPKTPDISINDRTVTEGNSVTFTVTLSEKTAGTVTVNYATQNGSAGAGDYVSRSGTLTFSPGQTSKTITISTVEDSTDELTENFFVKLSNASGGIIVDNTGEATLVDDDPTPQIRIGPAGQSLGTTGSVSEGETASFMVSLDRPSSSPITVAYATSEGTAIVDDFTGASGTLTFAPGQTSHSLTVTTLEDDIYEGSETFSVFLSNPSTTAILSSFYGSAEFNISDDDPLPSISVAPAAGNEGDVAGEPLLFNVTLSNPSSFPITVDYATADDSATAGSDYVSRTGTLNFAPLATGQSFTVALIGDDLDEGISETFTVNLSNPTNAAISAVQTPGTIIEDDFAPVAVAITGGSLQYTVDEGDELSLSAADTTDGDSTGLLYRWDINNDGEFDLVSDSTDVTVSATTMAALGLNRGDLSTSLRLEVSDGTNTGVDIVPLVIANVVPAFSAGDDILLSPEASGYLRRSISFTDPGLADHHSISVDYGDGSAPVVTALAAGTRTFTLNHQYPSAGEYTVQISVDDGDDTTTHSLTANVALGSSLPEVTFAGSNVTISEADGSLEISALLAAPSLQTAIVPLLFNGSAIRGGDYLPSSSFLEFAPGETTASVSLQLVNDRIFERDETIDVLMGIPTGARLGADTVRQFTITSDDNAPRVEFASAFQIVDEGATAQVTVQLSSTSAEDVTVPLEFQGSATGTSGNYQFPGSEIVIPAGSTSASKTLLISDDALAESAQVLLIAMGTPTGAVPAAAPATTVHTIIIPANDTPIVDLRAARMQVDEDHGTLSVLVDLSNPINTAVSVPYTLSGTATDGEDFTLSPDTPLTFSAGQTSAAIDLTVIDDLLAEPFDLETVVITFDSPDIGVLGNTRSFELAIIDNEVQRIDFTLDRQQVWEDDDFVTITINSTRTADSDITVPVIIIPGSAQLEELGADLPTEVVLPAGQNSASFTIPLQNDDRRESTESLTVQLGDPAGAQLGEITAHRVSILDDDPLVYLTVEQSSTVESGRGVNFTFRLSSRSNDDVTVNFQRFGTAKFGTDYTLSHSSSIVIPAGELTATVTATLREDAQVEGDESVGLRITGISGTNSDSVGRSTSFVVRNDDVSYAYFATQPAEVREGQAFDVTVRMTEALPSDVTFLVSRNILSNSASPNLDYTVSGLEQRKYLRIPAGETSASFRISIVDDDFIEASEVIELRLSQPSSSDVRIDSVNTLRYVVAASDTPSKKVILRAPQGFGLNEADLPPNVILVSDDLSQIDLGDVTVVDLGIDGNYIELPADEVVAVLGSLNVNDGGNTASSTRSNRSTPFPNYGSYTLAISANGELTPLERESALLENLGIDNLEIPEASFNKNLDSGALNIALGSGNANFSGSTLFFDANLNGVPDFVDLNGDGVQQSLEPVEPTAVTALDGSAELNVPFSMDVNGDGVLDAQDGRFVLIGGTDTATELPLQLRMESAIGHYNISPLSTIASKLVHQLGFLPTDAEARTLSAVQVEGASFARTSIVAAAAAGDTSAVRMALANAQIHSTAMAVSSLISGMPGAPTIAVLGELVFMDMADKIRDEGSLLDLSSASVVESIIRGVVFQTGLVPAESNIVAAVAVISDINARIGAIPEAAADALTQRAKLEIVSLGHLSPALAELSAGNLTAADAIQDFSGTPLEQRIAGAAPGIITPPRVGITSYRTLEGDGPGTLLYEVRIGGEVTRPVTVEYETVFSELTDGEFTPVSGTLTWLPGETGSKLIEVAYIGDSDFEGDEAVIVGLTSVTNAVLANELGAAYMINDDVFEFETSDTSTANQLQLVVDGGDATFDQNEENIFAGTFTESVSSIISGTAGETDILTLTVNSDSIFLAGGLTFEGQFTDGDVLQINNASADVVTRRITGVGQGTINIDGRMISYSGLTAVSDLLLPEITGLPPALEEGDTVTLGSLIPGTDDAADLTYQWTLSHNGILIAGDDHHSFQHAFTDNGHYEISLSVTAVGRATSTQIIEFSVGNADPTPVIDSISAVRVEGTQIDVTASATDPAGANDTLTYTYSVLKDGVAFASESGVDQTSFSFTPDDNGSYEITLTVSDEDGGSASVSQLITVANVDPAALSDIGTAVEDGPEILIDVLSNDTDPAAFLDPLVISGVDTSQTIGTVTFSDASVVYHPNGKFESLAANESAIDRFTYTVSDQDGGVSTATVTITVTGQNDAASISGTSTGTTDEDSVAAVTGALSVTDVDDGEDAFVPQSGIVGTYGTFNIDANGSWTYTLDNSSVQNLNAGDLVSDSFSVVSVDGTASELVVVTINGLNDAATISGTSSGTTDEDSVSAVTGALNVSDVDDGEDVFVAQSGTTGSYGSFDIDASGNWTYTLDNSSVQNLNAGDVVSDSFSVTSVDGTASELVVVTIYGLNDAPTVTSPITASADEDSAPFPVDLLVGASDVDSSDLLNAAGITLVSGDDSGVTIMTNGLIVDPSAYNYLAVGESAVIQYAYIIVDGNGGQVSQTATITVEGVNDAAVITSLTSSHPDFDNRSTDGAVNISGTFADADLTNTHSVTVDWGDGTAENVSVDQIGSAFSGTHQYASGGIFTITVTLDDADGSTDTLTTTAVVQGDGLVNGTLYVIGTSGRDVVVARQRGGRIHLDVWLNGQRRNSRHGVHCSHHRGGPLRFESYSHNHYSSADVFEIIVIAGDGDDYVDLWVSSTIPTNVSGGDGDDEILTAGANDTVSGARVTT